MPTIFRRINVTPARVLYELADLTTVGDMLFTLSLRIVDPKVANQVAYLAAQVSRHARTALETARARPTEIS